MSTYVLAFRGAPDRQAAPNEEEAWGAWFRGLGDKIVDFGNRVEHVQTLAADGGSGSDRGGLTGYIVIEAPDEASAAALAKGCPGLRTGVDVEIARTLPQ